MSLGKSLQKPQFSPEWGLWTSSPTKGLCELLGSSETKFGVSWFLFLQRMGLCMGPWRGAVTPSSPQCCELPAFLPLMASQCSLSTKQHIWTSLFICSSSSLRSYPMLPSTVTFGSAVFHPGSLQEGLCKVADTEGLRGACD